MYNKIKQNLKFYTLVTVALCSYFFGAREYWLIAWSLTVTLTMSVFYAWWDLRKEKKAQ